MKVKLEWLKRGYVIAYKNDGSKYGNLIEKFQKKEGYSSNHDCYTHVEISGGKEWSVYIRPPKSKFINIFETHKGREVCILRYKGENFKERRHAVAYFSAVLCNKRYDIKGILSFVFKWIKQDKSKPFCSEGCAWAYQMEYPEAFDFIDLSKVMPATFFHPYADFEVVGEGII